MNNTALKMYSYNTINFNLDPIWIGLLNILTMKIGLIVILIFITIGNSFAQNIKIQLTNKLGNRSIFNLFREAYRLNNISEYRGYDTSRYVYWAIKKIAFSIDQDNVANFMNGKISKKALTKMINRSGIDTNLIVYKIIQGNNMGIFIAVDNENSRHVIIDADGDNDFGNNKEFVFKSGEISYPKLDVKISYPDAEDIKSQCLPFFIDINPKHLKNDQLGIALLEKSYKEGVFKTKDGIFYIDLDNENSFLYKGESFFLTVMSAKEILPDDIAIDMDSIQANEALLKNYKLVNSRYVYSNKDSIQIGKSLYKIDSLTNNVLYLKYINEIRSHGEVNTIAPNIKGNDLLSEQYFELNKKRGRYVVIDFWGSWCGPCISALPRLVEIHKRYKQKGLVVLSVALDQLKDIGKLKSIIKDKKLDWNHLLIDRNKSNDILKSYMVQQYPTTILIDEKGRVVKRGTGLSVLEDIDKYLEIKLKR